jgi:multicomponent Na+:H+ antiporter subunit D
VNAVTPHLPVLQVLVPLFGALIAALLRRGTTAFVVALLVTWTTLVISALMLRTVLATGPIAYMLGSWPAPWGIEYRVDVLNGFVLFLVSAIAAVVTPFARRSVAFEIEDSKEAWFYCTYLLCLTGLLGIAVTGDAFNAFVFLEISSLSSYVLIALGPDRRAVLAAYQYLIMGTVGATFYVIGVGLLYLMTGTLNLTDIAARLGPAAAHELRPVLAALVFVTVGISLKLALFPLHAWLPNAYTYAPSLTTVFLSATATKVALYLLLRFFFSVFGVAIDLPAVGFSEVLIALSTAAILAASAIAVFQSDAKRMFAYSSLAQIGYMTLGFGLANGPGLTGSIAHLFNHAVMKSAVFLALGAVFFRLGTVNLAELAGAGRRMPLTMAALAVAGLGIVGVPGTAGFVSKWYLAMGALEAGSWAVVFLILASSFISMLYVGRVIELAWFRQPCATTERVAEPPLSMLAPLLVLAAATLYFGIDTDLTVAIAQKAASSLLGGLK